MGIGLRCGNDSRKKRTRLCNHPNFTQNRYKTCTGGFTQQNNRLPRIGVFSVADLAPYMKCLGVGNLSSHMIPMVSIDGHKGENGISQETQVKIGSVELPPFR